MRKKRILIVVGFILAGAAITLSFTLLEHKQSGNQYFTEAVERGPIRAIVNATGTVQAVVTVQVGSQVSGQIQALYADYNSIVKRGQLLAKIDPRNFQAEVANSKANLAAAEAHMRAAEADLATQEANLVSAKANLQAARVTRDNNALILKRYKQMVPSGIVAQNDFDTVKANWDSSVAKYSQADAAVQQVQAQINSQRAQVQQARAEVLQARADLNKAQVNLEYCNIYSPVDGVVVSRNVDVGQTVAASLQAPLLFVIANDLTKMQVNASVDEADIGHVSSRSKVSFTVDAYPSQDFMGKIAEIRLDPQTVQNVVTYSVIINVDNSDLRLKPGMTANITVTVAERDNALKIPNAALRYLPPGTTRADEARFIKKADGMMALRPDDRAAQDPVAQRRGTAATMPAIRSADNRSQSPSAITPALAPGQMWENSEKIRFPALPVDTVRPAVVWVLGPTDKPEPRRVMLGITDGAFTQAVRGEIKAGEKLIVADASQGIESPSSGVRSPFGFGPGHHR